MFPYLRKKRIYTEVMNPQVKTDSDIERRCLRRVTVLDSNGVGSSTIWENALMQTSSILFKSVACKKKNHKNLKCYYSISTLLIKS